MMEELTDNSKKKKEKSYLMFGKSLFSLTNQ